jgi:hypothetical protein
MPISDADRQAISARWAELVQAGAPSFVFPGAPLGINPQTVFCHDWPMAKRVLQALQSVVPQPGPTLTALVIAAGDASYQRVCPVGGAPKSSGVQSEALAGN